MTLLKFSADLVLVFSFIFLLIWAFIRYQFSFWKNLGIYGPEPTFPFGTISEFLCGRISNLDLLVLRYRQTKDKNLPYLGLYHSISPILLVTDVKLIKRIFVKDFEFFQNRGLYHNEHGEPITANILTLEDERWSNLRNKMSPAFSTGKLKSMFDILLNISEKLNETLIDDVRAKNDIDIYDYIARCTIDIISNVAFGIECGSLDDPSVPFYVNAKKTLDWDTINFAKMFISIAYPNFFRRSGLTFFPNGSNDVFLRLCREVVNLRKENGSFRNDILQVLIDLMEGPAQISFNDLLGQSFVFFFAGFETSATAISFAMYELAYNQEIQDILREQVRDSTERHGKICYESVTDIPLLQQIINETLRKYPPAFQLTRKVGKPYKIPGTDIVLPKDTLLVIPIYAIHNDPEYFPNPNIFDPYRFATKSKIDPDTYFPFGEGPRICIGMRFANLSSKLILAQLVSKYRFSISSDMKQELTPVEKHLTLSSKEKIVLNAEEIKF